MEKPVYTLEFEKPLRELTRHLDELRQQSLETNVDLASEIPASKRKSMRRSARSIPTSRLGKKSRSPAIPSGLTRSITSGCSAKTSRSCTATASINDDRALIGGTAFFQGEAVMIIAQQKGRDTKEKISAQLRHAPARRLPQGAAPDEDSRRNSACPSSPSSTPPAPFPASARKSATSSEAIAVNLREMAMLRTPSISVVVGEGGSGGALGIGVTDRVLIFENSYYSVISPEGCAAILWKDAAAAPKAAEALKLSADHLRSSASWTKSSPNPSAARTTIRAQAAGALKYALQKHLNDLRGLDTRQTPRHALRALPPPRRLRRSGREQLSCGGQ